MCIIMKKHIILFLLLAIAFTAIAAPAATPKTPAKKGGCRRFTSPILHTPPHKSVPTKQRLVRRSDIQLCGRNIRSKTADKCRDNPGYIENSSGKLEWVPGNGHLAGKECDHLVELQMVVEALQNANFCEAWDKIQALWVSRFKDTKIESTMKDHFDATVRNEANNKEGLFYVEKSFNLEKGKFVSDVVNHRTPKRSANLKGYFTSDYRKKAADIALKIDDAAKSLLNTFHDLAMPAGYNPETAPPEEDRYVCELGEAEGLFESHKKPVVAMWEEVQKSI